MPTWGELIPELDAAKAKHGPSAFDVVRRKYLGELASYTTRNTILYAARWTQPGGADPGLVSITLEDVQGMMEVVHGLDGSQGLDLILHSPGGSPDAAESVVHYLRSKFTDIRVIVPQAAMSAATMLACAANRIVLGKHSSLGPIDPQLLVVTQQGMMAHPRSWKAIKPCRTWCSPCITRPCTPSELRRPRRSSRITWDGHS